jgi:hypothetical protein
MCIISTCQQMHADVKENMLTWQALSRIQICWGQFNLQHCQIILKQLFPASLLHQLALHTCWLWAWQSTHNRRDHIQTCIMVKQIWQLLWEFLSHWQKWSDIQHYLNPKQSVTYNIYSETVWATVIPCVKGYITVPDASLEVHQLFWTSLPSQHTCRISVLCTFIA